MAFLKANAFFDNHIPGNNMLLIQAQNTLPSEFIRRYKKNAVRITPYKTGALRRSIITRTVGDGTAQISWRLPYAAAQNQGYHTVKTKRVVNIDGKYVTLKPGVYRYRNYTTEGTGAHFANIAFAKTSQEMPQVLREIGLTK